MTVRDVALAGLAAVITVVASAAASDLSEAAARKKARPSPSPSATPVYGTKDLPPPAVAPSPARGGGAR